MFGEKLDLKIWIDMHNLLSSHMGDIFTIPVIYQSGMTSALEKCQNSQLKKIDSWMLD